MKITYAINGSGLGHATRSLPLIQALTERQHNVSVYTQGLAKNFLQQQLEGTTIVDLPSYAQSYTNTLRGYCKTTLSNQLPFYRSQQQALTKALLKNPPDLIISDDEHSLSRIAYKYQILHANISFHCHGYELPTNLLTSDRIQSYLLNTMMQLNLNPGQLRIQSTPFNRKSSTHKSIQVPPILPKYLTHTSWNPQGTHIIIYFNQTLPINYHDITQYAKHRGLYLSFYGNTGQTLQSSSNQHATPHHEFIQDLLTADALICTPGSQLACEAYAIGLPTVLISPPRQRTQQLIARLFSQQCCNIEHIAARQLSQHCLDQALNNITEVPEHSDASGLEQTMTLIEQLIDRHHSHSASPSQTSTIIGA